MARYYYVGYALYIVLEQCDGNNISQLLLEQNKGV